MKKTLILTAVLAAFIFSSCNTAKTEEVTATAVDSTIIVAPVSTGSTGAVDSTKVKVDTTSAKDFT